MNTMSTPLLPSTTADASKWDRALYSFLAEKEERSGSVRTVESYSRMLRDFYGRLGKPPDRVTSPDVLAFAYGVGLSGREPSSVTIGARIACISSLYRFLARMGAVVGNPCDQFATIMEQRLRGRPRGRHPSAEDVAQARTELRKRYQDARIEDDRPPKPVTDKEVAEYRTNVPSSCKLNLHS